MSTWHRVSTWEGALHAVIDTAVVYCDGQILDSISLSKGTREVFDTGVAQLCSNAVCHTHTLNVYATRYNRLGAYGKIVKESDACEDSEGRSRVLLHPKIGSGKKDIRSFLR